MMKALVWHGKHDVRVDTVPEPQIKDGGDVIVEITSTAICGSDLHLYDGMMPTMEEGDILGHEPMGIVVETGRNVKNLKRAIAWWFRLPSHAARAGTARWICFRCATIRTQMRRSRGKPWANRRPAVRVFTHAGRLSGRAGAIFARSLCGRGAD